MTAMTGGGGPPLAHDDLTLQYFTFRASYRQSLSGKGHTEQKFRKGEGSRCFRGDGFSRAKGSSNETRISFANRVRTP